jgi:phage terminase large subunit-like protein
MCVFTPDLDRKTLGSPDRVDALVWGLTHLLIKGRKMVAQSVQG